MTDKEPKRTCDQCGAAEAVVHLTQIVSNEMRTSHLCEKCAAVKGVDSRRQASEHCAESGKGAVWYGHDRDGNMHYRCE